MWEYILIGVLAAAVIGLIVVLVILLIRRSHKPDNAEKIAEATALGEVKAKIDLLNSAIPQAVNQSLGEVKGQLSKEISEQVNKQGEATNVKLERFQETINGSIEKKFSLLDQRVDTKFGEINKRVDERLGSGFETTTKAVGEVKERLVAIDKAQEGLKDLSTNVVDLKTILEGNQTRGQYGEFQLEEILHSVFGDTTGIYELQYVIKEGATEDAIVKPDAVVFVPEPNKMICIDSKFPYQEYKALFDNVDEAGEDLLQKKFRADVKNRINEVKRKYIIDNVTAPQALLFIPNDGIFAYVHVHFPDLVEEARKGNVILTSPSTLQPILATINMLRISYQRTQNYKALSEQLQKLGVEFKGFDAEWSSFSKNLKMVYSNGAKLDNRVSRMTRKFEGLKNSETGETDENTIEIPNTVDTAD